MRRRIRAQSDGSPSRRSDPFQSGIAYLPTWNVYAPATSSPGGELPLRCRPGADLGSSTRRALRRSALLAWDPFGVPLSVYALTLFALLISTLRARRSSGRFFCDARHIYTDAQRQRDEGARQGARAQRRRAPGAPVPAWPPARAV